ncbi:AP2/ERF [Ectocarpus sp. CCAP 1310/34]|nr:AP2/ERF [Ectocarpus sp. CCAP 1310/34]
MSGAAPPAMTGNPRDGPRPEVSRNVESRPSSPPAFPPPPLPAAPGATSRVASSEHDVAAKAAQSAPGATGRASSSGHRAGVGAPHASPQDPEASGWDVLMGAVNLELKRSEPAAPNTTPTAASTAAAAAATTSASDTARHRSTVAASVAPSSSPSAMVRGCGVFERGPRGASPPDGPCAGGRTDAYFGNRDIVAACRALRTLPHVPVDDAPGSGSAPVAVGAGSVSLPGFSMTKNVAAPTVNAVMVKANQEPPAAAAVAPPSAVAATGPPPIRMIDFVRMPESTSPPPVVAAASPLPPPLPPPPPPLQPPSPAGPTARDIYAGAAMPTVPAAASAAVTATTATPSPDLAHAAAPAASKTGAASPGANTPQAAAKPRAAKSKAVRSKAAESMATRTKAKAHKVRKAPKAPKAKKRKKDWWVRRGPPGQSSFKGVCITPAGTWRAVIYVDRKQKYLGVFDSEFDAARAYDAAARVYCPGSQLNNPDQIERELHELSAADGKPFATAGAEPPPERPRPPPPPPPLRQP